MFHVAFFAENFFWSLWSIAGCYLFTTFITVSLEEFTRITKCHQFLVSHTRMNHRKWDAILDMKCELLPDDLKGFLRNRATKNTLENMVDIILGNF